MKKWMRTLPVWTTAWLLLGVIVFGEGVWLRAEVRAWRAATHTAGRLGREFRALHARSPAPTPENSRAIQADLDDAGDALAAMWDELAPDGPLAEQLAGSAVPARRAEAYFDLAAFIETMRQRARRAGVVLAADECFGFSAYTHEAPEPGRIGAVFRSRLQVQALLEPLLAAQPAELLGVQREVPAIDPALNSGSGSREVPAVAPGKRAAADCFVMPRALTLRRAGCIDTAAYRVTFIGRTEVLRDWLNRLAESGLPVAVRLVEAKSGRPLKDPARRRGESGPLVSSALSQFCVTVEFIAPPAPAA